MPTIKSSLHLTDKQVKYANFASVSTTVITRLIIGPLCDSYGPKNTLALILLLAALPSLIAGVVVHDGLSLTLVRAAIGVAGGSFVSVQAWIPLMFSRRVVGTANATVAGWGNLGGGLTQVLSTTLLLLPTTTTTTTTTTMRRRNDDGIAVGST